MDVTGGFIVRPQQPSVACRRETHTCTRTAGLDTEEHLQPGVARIDVGDIAGIGMSEPGIPEHASVLVQRCCAQDQFIASVFVYIRRDQTVGAGTWQFVRITCLASPDPLQVLIERRRLHQVVRPALHDERRGAPVKVGDGEHVTLRSVVLVPTFARMPGGARHLLAGAPVNLHEVFGPFDDASVDRARIALTGLRIDLRCAVAIDVVDDVRRVPDASLDGPAHVVAPHQLSRHAVVRLELERFRAPLPIPFAMIWVGVEIRLFDHVIEHAVGIQISDAHAARRVRAVQRDRHIRPVPVGRRHVGSIARLNLAAVDEGMNAIAVGAPLSDLRVDVGGAVGQRCRGEPHEVGSRVDVPPVDVEPDVCGVALEKPPTDGDRSRIVRQRDDAASNGPRCLGCHGEDAGPRQRQGGCESTESLAHGASILFRERLPVGLAHDTPSSGHCCRPGGGLHHDARRGRHARHLFHRC